MKNKEIEELKLKIKNSSDEELLATIPKDVYKKVENLCEIKREMFEIYKNEKKHHVIKRLENQYEEVSDLIWNYKLLIDEYDRRFKITDVDEGIKKLVLKIEAYRNLKKLDKYTTSLNYPEVSMKNTCKRILKEKIDSRPEFKGE